MKKSFRQDIKAEVQFYSSRGYRVSTIYVNKDLIMQSRTAPGQGQELRTCNYRVLKDNDKNKKWYFWSELVFRSSTSGVNKDFSHKD